MRRASHPEFSDRTLGQLLDALHARSANNPDNPGLIACWPAVRENRMAAACAELKRRGHPVLRLLIDGTKPGSTRESWAIRAPTDWPVRASTDGNSVRPVQTRDNNV